MIGCLTMMADSNPKLQNKRGPLAVEALELLRSRSFFPNALALATWFEERPPVKHTLSFLGNPFLFDMSKKDLLLQAFTHPSFAHECLPTSLLLPHNERLEFLGDAVLEILVSALIVERFPSFTEGKLTVLRSIIVNEGSLAHLASFMGLEKALLLGRGELGGELGRGVKGRVKEKLLCDAFEALLGAVFQERGFEGSQKAFHFLLERYRQEKRVCFISSSLERLRDFNAKSRLQEFTLAHFKSLPEYRSTPVGGGRFQVDLFIEGKRVGRVTEGQKKRGEQKLAREALAKMDLC